MKYFFRLGKNPNISLAEIEAVLDRFKIQYDELGVSPEIALIDCDTDLREVFKALGGSIKFGIVLDGGLDEGVAYLNSLPVTKVFFGISTVTAKVTPSSAYKTGMVLKKQVTKSARLVTSKEAELSSVIVKNEKLLSAGAEFIFFDINGKVMIGRTLDVQDFKEYGHRDFDRPGFDALSGMLPPKLAQMMCNIANIKNKDAVILDPFCGSGTVLGELLSLGYTQLLGSDISTKAIEDTTKNLEWMQKEYNSNLKNVSVQVCDARKISQFTTHVDAVVTEPFLGKPLRGNESRAQLDAIQKELKELYKDALREIRKIMSAGGRAVIIVPAIKTKKEVLYLDVLRDFEGMGWKIVDDFKRLDASRDRSPLAYTRPNQHIIREIVVLEKK